MINQYILEPLENIFESGKQQKILGLVLQHFYHLNRKNTSENFQ